MLEARTFRIVEELPFCNYLPSHHHSFGEERKERSNFAKGVLLDKSGYCCTRMIYY